MLTVDEVEAVALGCQWVVAHADVDLARAALDVLAKVAAIVPEDLRPIIDDPVVGTPPRDRSDDERIDMAKLREWCRTGRKLAVRYVDETGTATDRTVRPFLIGYVATVRAVIAWCELRQDFRIFRTDRIETVDFIAERYREHPVLLRRRWLAKMRDMGVTNELHMSQIVEVRNDRP